MYSLGWAVLLGLTPTARLAMLRSWPLKRLLVGLGCGAVCLLANLPADAVTPIRAVISAVGGKPAGPSIERMIRATSGESVKEWSLQAPWEGDLNLPLDRSWKLHAVASGFWARDVSLEVGTAVDWLEILLFPAGSVGGKLRSPEGGALPRMLLLKISPPPPRQGEQQSSIPTSELSCPITEGAFNCTLPAGILDLKLQVGSYAPHYLWATEIIAGKTADLGTLQLRSGASVVGWVEVAGRAEEDDSPVVELRPPPMGWNFNPREEERQAMRAVTTTVDEHGFFQAVGLLPGGYQLTASKPGFAMAESVLVDVAGDRETVLEEHVVLQPLHPLEIYLDPPTTPAGASWQVEVSRERATIPVLDVVATSAASPSGFWRSQELAPGTYRLSVSDSAGSTWLEQKVELEPTSSPLYLEIPLIPIKGRVTLGKEPIRAIVSFGTSQGRPEIRLATNEDGEFEGYLPREGEWPVELILGERDAVAQAIEPVLVEKPPGSEPAHVEIELPDTKLPGMVVEGDVPVAGAGVLVIRYGDDKKRREAMLQTDKDGRFELRGLSEGELDLRARHLEKSSAWIHAQLREGREAAPLVLRLEEKTKIAGQVLSPAGPVAGANVVALPGGTAIGLAMGAQAVTAADGSFTLEAPAGTRWLDVIVVPAGLPVQLVRIDVDKGRQAPVVLQLGSQGGDLLVAEMPTAPDPKVVLEPLLLVHGSTAADVRWLLQTLAFGRSRLDQEGIKLFGLEAGDYSLCRGSGSDCTSGFLAIGGQLSLVTPSNLGNLEKFRQLMEAPR